MPARPGRPIAGRNLQAWPRTRNGDGYVLDGAKSAFVSNGGVARTYVVFACVEPDKGLSGSGMFVVDGDSDGLTRGAAEDRIGLRALNQASVSLDGVRVPDDQLLFPPSDAYRTLHHAIMTVGNLGTGYLAVGLMRAAYEEAGDRPVGSPPREGSRGQWVVWFTYSVLSDSGLSGVYEGRGRLKFLSSLRADVGAREAHRDPRAEAVSGDPSPVDDRGRDLGATGATGAAQLPATQPPQLPGRAHPDRRL
jgi:hypothetical protein